MKAQAERLLDRAEKEMLGLVLRKLGKIKLTLVAQQDPQIRALILKHHCACWYHRTRRWLREVLWDLRERIGA